MSIEPDSPGRGAAAFYRQPVDQAARLGAQNLVETLYYYNCRRSICTNLPDMEYRSSDQDILHHVFRWDNAPFDFVFQNGFEARRQANFTSDEEYFNLQRYVNSGGRPLDTRRETTYAFISTTLASTWFPPDNRSGLVYHYEIYAPGGILVAETLGNLYHHPAQDEVAFPAGIAPQYIRSAQIFERDRRFRRWTARSNILYTNRAFNPQSHPARRLIIQNPVREYVDEYNVRWDLIIKEFPDRQKRSVGTNDELTEYYINGVTNVESYIDSAFRSTRKNEAYIFFKNDYALMNYAPGSTNDRIVNGPLFIGNSFYSLVGTAFAEYGIDAAFSCHADNEAMIFSGNLCARINYAPGTTNDKIIGRTQTITQMFPFFKGTNFAKGIDAAFESTFTGEAYLFKGSEYALIHYDRRTVVSIRPIINGFPILRNSGFERDIGAAFASHVKNEAYLFKGNKYMLIHFTPRKTEDYIIGGPKEVVPSNWPSLKNILPHKNSGLNIYKTYLKSAPERDHDEL